MIRLIVLLADSTLTNKELAIKMSLSSSALSGILQRIKKCEIDLLAVRKEDKNILYSLTPIAREYAEKKLLEAESQKNIRLVQINQLETVEWRQCTEALEGLKEQLGTDWAADFQEYCVFYYTDNREKVPSEVSHFLETLEELVIEGQLRQFDRILDQLDEFGLKNLCLKYINNLINIRKLCSLDEGNWELAGQFIDELFLSDMLYVSIDFLDKCYIFTKKDITDMAKALSEIIKKSCGKIFSKNDFIASWGRYFRHHDQLVFYIGEKYVNKYHGKTL